MDFPVLTRFRPLNNSYAFRVPKTNPVLIELLNTEQKYVQDLHKIIEFYVKPFENPGSLITQIPASLRGQSNRIFGNIRELYELHNDGLLPELLKESKSPGNVCQVFVDYQERLFNVYKVYCHNKSDSDALLCENNAENCKFFVHCRRRTGDHILLSTYLLIPIQRLFAYKLLLEELMKSCSTGLPSNNYLYLKVGDALDSISDLIGRLNKKLKQVQVYGFNGNFSALGRFRMQAKCQLQTFKVKTHRLANKVKQRTLLFFDHGILFCKTRSDSPYMTQKFNFKSLLSINKVDFIEYSGQALNRFEVWNKTEKNANGYSIFVEDEFLRARCIRFLIRKTSYIENLQEKNDTQVIGRPSYRIKRSGSCNVVDTCSSYRSTMRVQDSDYLLSRGSFRNNSIMDDDMISLCNSIVADNQSTNAFDLSQSSNVSALVSRFEALRYIN